MLTHRIAGWLGGTMIAALLSLLLTSHANAASFDCAKAANPEQKAVCGNPTLSRLDEEIARSYDAASARLPPAERNALAGSQDRWIEATTEACSPVSDDLALLSACLEMPYKLRQQDLANAVQMAGPFTFLRMSRYKFVPCQAAMQCDGSFRDGGYLHASVPRLVSPATVEATQWNALVATTVPPLALQDNTDVTLDFRIAGVSPNMISVRFDLREYAHRAAGGSVFIRSLNVILPALKPITADDLFTASPPWSSFLYERTMNMVRDALPRDANQGAQIELGRLREIVEQPERWTITPGGLAIMFSPSDLDLQVSAPWDAVIPWPELQPYLRKPLPFQLPQ